MIKFANLLTDPKIIEEVTKAEVSAMGQPAAIMQGFIVPATASSWKYYAGWTDKIGGENYAEEGGQYRLTTYEPYGVCAGIGPWNVTIR